MITSYAPMAQKDSCVLRTSIAQPVKPRQLSAAGRHCSQAADSAVPAAPVSETSFTLAESCCRNACAAPASAALKTPGDDSRAQTACLMLPGPKDSL